MSKEEIEDTLEGGIVGNEKFTIADIADLQKKVNVNLQASRGNKTCDYYYEINCADLESSSISKKDVIGLMTKGWRYNKEKYTLIKKI